MSYRIVHLGVGNFHRAHQAWYTAKANLLTNQNWKITGVSLRRDDMRKALEPQGYAYTLQIQDGVQAPRYEKLEVLDSVLVASKELPALLTALADPQSAIITLTITEKGYCLQPSNWRLNLEHPEIKADLASSQPKTALGVLVAGLELRKKNGVPAPTIISCDNLPNNSAVLKQALIDYASVNKPELAKWITEKIAFPSCLVDRIVPATTSALRADVKKATGFDDASPVACEEFSQWIIEDHFVGPRPAWEKAGVELVTEVGPYERRKLRMLNGAHSTFAYAGLLAGKTYVHEAVADSKLLEHARGVMLEAMETLEGAARETAPAYATQLEKRFANSGLKHELKQIAMDGSQKLPVRMLASLGERLSQGKASPFLERSVAAWATWVARELKEGRVLNDPAYERLKQSGKPLEDAQIFGEFFKKQPEAKERISKIIKG